MRTGIHDETHARAKKASRVQEKRELSLEQIEQLLGQLRLNFESNNRELPELHPQTQWAQVEASLRAQPEVMWSLSRMEETGGMVDVIEEDDGSFLFGDTSKESPAGRKNVVFDADAATYAREHFWLERSKFKENAADRVKAWGVDFMDEHQYRALQDKGRFDTQTWSWLKTPSNIRQAGFALVGYYLHGCLFVRQRDAFLCLGYGGFRCALRVKKLV